LLVVTLVSKHRQSLMSQSTNFGNSLFRLSITVVLTAKLTTMTTYKKPQKS